MLDSRVRLTPTPWRTELRACVALSWPLMLTNAIEMALNLTNVAMIGRISPEALAASTLAFALYNVLLLFGIGVTASVSALIARELGRGGDRTASVRRIAQQGLWGALLLAGPIWLILWNSPSIFAAAGQAPDVAAEAGSYLRMLQWAIGPALVYLVLRSVFTALDRPRWTIVTGVCAIALNGFLNWVLIGGHLGMPAMGLQGSALATVTANLFMAGALAAVGQIDPHLAAFRLYRGIARPDWTGFGALWRLGLPIGIGLVLETGMFAAAAVIIGRVDTASLAAHAIAIQVASFTFMVPLGLAQAVTVRVGRAYGARDRAGIARAGWTALALSFATMVLSASILVLWPRTIIGLFIDVRDPGTAAVVDIATLLLWIAALFQVADGSQAVLSGMLRGLQQTRVPMFIAACGYWAVGVPTAALLALGLHLGASGVWVGLTSGLFSTAIMLLVLWLKRLQGANAT